MARLLILAPQLPVPPHALTGSVQGTTIRNFNLLAGLAKRHTVDLVTFLPLGVGEDAVELVRPYCREILALPQPARKMADRTRDTLVGTAPDMALRLHSPHMHAALFDLVIRSPGYDVVQVEGIEMAPYMLALQQRWSGPRPRFVYDDHNAEYVLQQRAFMTDARRPKRWIAATYSLIQWRKLTAYERRVCRSADRVVAVSDVDRAALLRLDPALNVTTIPNGVDLDFYYPGVTQPAPEMTPDSLVFTGKMDYRPNIDAVTWFAAAVFPLIRQRVPAACFYIVGQQPSQRVMALAQRAGIVVTGKVRDTRPYIAGAGVYIIPLRIGGGTRLKVLEAMAMGQALVSTRLGCDGFPFADGREISYADEPQVFADRVVSLLENRDEAERLGHAARAAVEADYGWDAIVPQLEALYK